MNMPVLLFSIMIYMGIVIMIIAIMRQQGTSWMLATTFGEPPPRQR